VKETLKSTVKSTEYKSGTFCIMDLLVIVICVMKVIVKTSLNRAYYIVYGYEPET